ncbi:MAG TPA: hypothetical protein VFY40_03405 [Blastocatellia bacterium]|jgi:hypothetical protein|nr:hypothetical protein [Blastocatellia bacterium]
MSAKRQRQKEKPKEKKKRASKSEEEKKRESGLPGGSKGRKDVIGRTGVFPVSRSEGASPDALVHDEMSFGQGERGAAGYYDHGESEIIDLDRLAAKLSGKKTSGSGKRKSGGRK